MSTWSSLLFPFPSRRAMWWIPEERMPLDVTKLLVEDGTRAEALCGALLDEASEGRYAHASLVGVRFDMERACWVVVFTHPACDPVAPMARAPALVLDYTPTTFWRVVARVFHGEDAPYRVPPPAEP
jgi:hypothetical protein